MIVVALQSHRPFRNAETWTDLQYLQKMVLRKPAREIWKQQPTLYARETVLLPLACLKISQVFFCKISKTLLFKSICHVSLQKDAANIGKISRSTKFIIKID